MEQVKQDFDKLDKAKALIFEVEQKWKKEKQDHISHILFKARIEINNAINNAKSVSVLFPE